MTFEEAADELDRRATELEQRSKDLGRRAVELLLESARAHSRGPLQPRQLARMGHPYALASGPRLNPNIVNQSGGDFEAGWDSEMDADGLGGRVFQTNPKAAGMERGLVFGRPLMVPRHPEEDAFAEAEPRVRALETQLVHELTG